MKRAADHKFIIVLRPDPDAKVVVLIEQDVKQSVINEKGLAGVT